MEIHVRAFTRLIQLKKKKNFALLQYAHFKGGTWFKSTSLHSHNANPTRLSILLRIADAPSVQTFADLLQSNFREPTHLAPNLYNILRTFADRLQSNFGNRRSLRLTCTILWEHLQTYCNPTFNFDEPTHLAPNMFCIFGEHLQTHCNPTRLTLQRL